MTSSKITIFTPTYNRRNILKNCYKSLCNQTNKNFIWLIVDDGSKDNTEELVENWIREKKVEIKYIKQKNSGKHVAHNTAVNFCGTDIFVCVDSDDYLTKDAVEVIYENWDKVESDSQLSGIIALKSYSTGKLVGTRMPENINICSLFDLYSKHKFKGDTMLIYKTSILKNYLFPVFKDEKFVTEAVIYDQIDQSFKMLLLDRVLYICEYLEDGYSKNLKNVHRANPKAYIYFLNQRIKFAKSTKEKYIAISYYLAGNWIIRNKNIIKNSDQKILYTLAIPKATIIFIKPLIKNLLIKLGVIR
ncbi:glycosyltransferase family 2 protein [Neobacillus novalis]|uniref:Glycosyltransferase family 2 protein n=1 Tax=Neobacillus novalis TaxID=220687 RepID=A0AA95MLU5_9BACI|nr:glycosyltransferase family 2 protein [Neobacillus novalis]WHY86071.1 glycosyltransferase family 2 protein [Neobacillus novalis]